MATTNENDFTPESVHADDLDISEEELALVYDTADLDTEAETEAEAEETTEVEEDAETEPEPETEEEAAEEESEPEPEQHRIPKSRFDEVNRKAQEAKAEADELRRRLEALEQAQKQLQTPEAPKQQAFDFDAKEREYMEAVLDGETTLALQIRGEIRSAERAEAERLALEFSSRTVENDRMTTTIQSRVAEINQQNPMYDPQSEAFNEEAFNYAMTIRDGLLATGRDPLTAINEAVRVSNALYGTPAKAAAPKAAPKPAVSKQKLETAGKQPPSIGDKASQPAEVGKKLDIINMSESEFDALSEAELAKLLA